MNDSVNSQQVEDAYPLSPMQQGIMFHTLQDPESGAYVEQLRLSSRGLDPTRLEDAWRKLIERHPVLRTSIVGASWDEPAQVVLRQVPIAFARHDCHQLSEPEARDCIARFLAEDRFKGFDLSDAGLARLTVIDLGDERREIILTYHHVILDGWSLPLLVRELFQLHGGERSLPKPRPYRDYIAWLARQDMDCAERFWRDRMAGFATPTPIGVGHTSAPGQHIRNYGQNVTALSENLTSALRAFGRAHEVTLNTILLGAWALLLSRYSDEDDIVFGTVVSGRPPEIEQVGSMVGLFINTLPMRVRVPRNAPLKTWLQSIQVNQTSQRDYEYTPLWQVQKWIDIPAGTHLFETLFIFENYPVQATSLPHANGGNNNGARVSATASPPRMAYPLALLVVPGQRLELRLAYDADRFDEETIERMGGHLTQLIEAMVAAPDAPLASIPMLTDAERAQVINAWNDTAVAYPDDNKCIHELFEQQAERTPDAVAIVFGEETLPYGALNRRANHLAQRLHDVGVGAEDLVGVCMERSPEMVVGLLGILKAGGAYVPLDPAFPDERLAYMAADAGAVALVTAGDVLERIEPLRTWATDTAAAVLRLDADAATIDRCETTRSKVTSAPDRLAYVIYTSGSTGRPKGVEVPHASVTNFLRSMAARPGLSADDVMLAVTTLSFDIAVLELFGPLSVGGRVVIASRETAADGALLRAEIERTGATVLQGTPATWQILLDADWRNPTLKMLCGGEVLPRDLADALLDAGGELWNMFGPTETTVWSAVARVTPGVGPVPLGQPIANTQIYLLDRYGAPVPIGARGEIYIGGAGVARGYHDRPTLTAERFVADPFTRKRGATLYRTGDLGRFDVHGNLQFLGRQDGQVKLRGFRIECGEIESALTKRDGIDQAVVILREDRPGDHQLVAYITLDGGTAAEPRPAELRQMLAPHLPSYMIPSAFVVLDALPLTPNGKIDRRALPHPERRAAGPRTAPTTPTQKILASIWGEVLDLENVGLEDDFFELGGHSLLTMQVGARVRQRLARDLRLTEFFAHPTLDRLAARIDTLPAETPETIGPALVPMPRDEAPPLSFAQHRLWVLNQLGAGSGYNIPHVMRLRGELNVDALHRALNAIVARHETLRTTFRKVDGRAEIVITPELDLPLSIIDVTHAPAEQREDAARARAIAEASAPFDLSVGPVIRAKLMRLAADDHVLVLTVHHIAFDGWSSGVLLGELTEHYRAFTTDDTPNVPALPIQYSDFAHWQRNWLEGEPLERQLEYWRERLGDDLPVVTLPTDHPRPAVQTFAGATHWVPLSPQLWEAVQALGRRHGATPAITCMAAFALLLQRYTGQDDVVVGTPIANRRRRETEDLIGFFVNMLVMRTDLSGDPTFAELLARQREIALGAYEHQDIPFEQLVEALDPERDLSRTPLFQLAFIVQNAPGERPELPGLTIHGLDLGGSTTRFDMEIHLAETRDGAGIRFLYNTDLFRRATIERFASHYANVLEATTLDPTIPLSQVPMLTDAELRQVVTQWNDTDVAHPIDRCVHELFERQVQATPDSVALVDDAGELTFRELNARANQLAHHLQRGGLAPGAPIGLLQERSREMVIAMLAAIKAGGAYMPIDPEHPAERIGLILDEAQAPIVLTATGLADRLPETTARVVRLDAAGTDIASAPADDLAPVASSESPAYVLYTSGSTGRPKGVVIPHRALVNHMAWMQRAFPIGADDRVLQKTPYTFDASVWEFFAPILTGGQLVMAAPGAHREPSELIALIQRHAITTLQLVPSLLRALLDHPDWAACTSVRRVFCGGEALPSDLAERFRATMSASLHNLYGPTEATIDSTMHTYDPAEEIGATVPIGRPIDNARTYVLDRSLNPVAIGVAGELYIGGAGLATGYLANPASTAACFVPSPFDETPGTRLYRTGDLVRARADGSLEFVGRTDHQVKLRGYRIELGEIESVLAEHPAVRATVALIRADDGEAQRLVAYVVPAESVTPQEDDLRAFLAERLPEYMVPAAFVTLDAFPLTTSGKVARNALPAPGASADTTGRDGDADGPRDHTEELLSEIWAEVLGIERVGIHDRFFRLGGDSILSIQAVARASAVGLRFTAKQMFQHQTVAELAEVINAERTIEAEQGPVTGDVPLTPIQHVFFERDLRDAHHFNHVMLVSVRHPMTPSACRAAVRCVLDHHDALRLRYTKTADGWLQSNAPPDDDVPFEHVDLSALPKAERGTALTKKANELQGSLDLTDGPLVRFALFEFGADEPARLLMVIHHLIVDGISWRVLHEDLQRASEQVMRGEEPRLPAKTSSFQIWSRRLREHAVSDDVTAELDYWRGLPWNDAGAIPIDHDRDDNTMAAIAHVGVNLDEDETSALLHEVPSAYNTQINDVLLTALAQTLSPWTGQRAVLLDLEGHGREDLFDDVDVSRTIGWFTSLFPVLLRLPGDGDAGQDPETSLTTIKEQLRQLPIRGIGYGLLRYMHSDASVRTELAALPHSQVSFNYLGQFDQMRDQSSMFGGAIESSGEPVSLRNERPYLLDVSASVTRGCLHVFWLYNRTVHDQATIERLAGDYLRALRALISHCTSGDAGGFTASDLAAFGLDASAVDELMAEAEQSPDR